MEILNIAVCPEQRRQGIGTALINELLGTISGSSDCQVWLEVRKSNSNAIGFYQKHGFVARYTRPNYYSLPVEDAVVMSLERVTV